MDYDKFFEQIKDYPIFFVEIGAMDGVTHDPLHKYIVKYRWKGILVEPLPDQMERLRKNYEGVDGLLFENSAITESAGERTIYTVPGKYVEQGLVKEYADGISSFFKGNLKMIPEEFIEEVRVKTVTFQDLVTKYSVDKIDILQIDAEGYDFEIMKQVDLKKFQPYFIRIEIWNLSDADQVRTITLLHRGGYDVHEFGLDLIGVKKRFNLASEFKSIWYKQIWSCYSNKQWGPLLRKSRIFQLLYQDLEQDELYQYVLFFFAFSLQMLEQHDKSRERYKRLLRISNLNPEIRVWALHNVNN